MKVSNTLRHPVAVHYSSIITFSRQLWCTQIKHKIYITYKMKDLDLQLSSTVSVLSWGYQKLSEVWQSQTCQDVLHIICIHRPVSPYNYLNFLNISSQALTLSWNLFCLKIFTLLFLNRVTFLMNALQLIPKVIYWINVKLLSEADHDL